MSKLNKQKDYTHKLYKILDELRARGVYPEERALLDKLRKDFDKEKELFSADEYKDPGFIYTLKVTISRRAWRYSIPKEVLDFIHSLTDKQKVLYLYSGVGDNLLNFSNVIGIEPDSNVAEWAKFLVDISESKTQIINEDPLKFQASEKFDVLVATPPFGSRNIEESIIGKIKELLNPGGKVFIIFPESVFFGTHFKTLRDKVSTLYGIKAIISLPTNTFQPFTSVKSSLLILENKKSTNDSYIAESKNLSDLKSISDDYKLWSEGKNISIGFVRKLSTERWDAKYYEPVDYNLAELKFPHQTLQLGEIATIVKGRDIADAKIAINRTGSKISWIDDGNSLIEKNNYYLKTNEKISPYYLYLFLISSVGRKSIDKSIKGLSIPYITIGDLLNIPIIIPNLQHQNEIVNKVVKLRETLNALDSLLKDGNKAISENLFELDSTMIRFGTFAQQAQEAYYKFLPFPIAITYRKLLNATNFTQKFALMIELFEISIRYITIINLVDYVDRLKKEDNIRNDIPRIFKIERPSLGDWVEIFKSLVNIKTSEQSSPFVKEIKDFDIRKFEKIIMEFVHIRNTSLRGHGSTTEEELYEMKFQEYFPKLEEFIQSLSFISNYRLVKVEKLDKDGDFYVVQMKEMMGENPVFELASINVRVPIDTHKVLLLNSNNEYLILDPFLILVPCPECHRNEALLFDKFDKNKIMYYSCEGHRPVPFDNVDKLPLSIRAIVE